MKLFVVTCLKEYLEDVRDIFSEADISVFSVMDVSGFKGNHHRNILADWFASGEADFNSSMIFSFTDAVNAEHAVARIKSYNDKSGSGFPVHAFIMPVEQSSY